MGGSGSSPSSEKDRLSASPSQSEQQAGELRHILIVEDNVADVLLIRHAIKAANIHAHLHVINDGEQAIRFFDQLDGDHAAPCPALVILDINLPKKQGGEVLQHMRKSRRSADSLVIAVSTSDSARDREDMTKLGANSYFRKPSEYVNFMKLGNVIKELLNSVA
jgi:DNA-binding response OmpR family regulator